MLHYKFEFINISIYYNGYIKGNVQEIDLNHVSGAERAKESYCILNVLRAT